MIPILLLVDILSRKAWAYVLTKSKKEIRAAVSVKPLQEFKAEVGLIKGFEGDNEFSSAAIKTNWDDNDIAQQQTQYQINIYKTRRKRKKSAGL